MHGAADHSACLLLSTTSGSLHRVLIDAADGSVAAQPIPKPSAPAQGVSISPPGHHPAIPTPGTSEPTPLPGTTSGNAHVLGAQPGTRAFQPPRPGQPDGLAAMHNGLPQPPGSAAGAKGKQQAARRASLICSHPIVIDDEGFLVSASAPSPPLLPSPRPANVSHVILNTSDSNVPATGLLALPNGRAVYVEEMGDVLMLQMPDWSDPGGAEGGNTHTIADLPQVG